MTEPLKCNTAELKVGDWVSRASYMRVVKNDAGGLEVQNEHGMTWSIGHHIVSAECFSTYFRETREVNRTELSRLMREEARDSIFVCSFLKAVTEDHVAELLATIADAPAAMDARRRKALAKDLMKGERRELTGYMLGVEESTGRFKVIDLKAEGVGRARERQVDPRTLEWVVLRNIKYVVK